MRFVPFLAALVALSVPATARAHDLWMERAGDALVLRYGHRGGEALALERSRVTSFRCVESGAGRERLPEAAFAERAVTLSARCRAASAAWDGGFWSLTPDGEVNRPRPQVPEAVKAWASRQYAKWVDARAGAGGAVVGDELEVVAGSDLAKVRQGDRVTVRVLFRGKPAPGAIVAIDHRPLGETDSAGEVRVRVRAGEVETLTATLRRKLEQPEAETEVLEASLTFEVSP
jgi:nickel transport protein